MAAVCLTYQGLCPGRSAQQAILQTIYQDTHTTTILDLNLILPCCAIRSITDTSIHLRYNVVSLIHLRLEKLSWSWILHPSIPEPQRISPAPLRNHVFLEPQHTICTF